MAKKKTKTTIKLPKIKMTLKLSQKAVKHLMKKHSIKEKDVAKWFNSTTSYIEQVAKGKKLLLPKHLKYLEHKNPTEYAELWESLCAEVIGETIDAGTDFVKKKSEQGVTFLRSLGTDAALAVGKILTKDD